MKQVITKVINGYIIVVGLAEPGVDPVRTANKAAQIFQEEERGKKYEKQNKEYREAFKAMINYREVKSKRLSLKQRKANRRAVEQHVLLGTMEKEGSQNKDVELIRLNGIFAEKEEIVRGNEEKIKKEMIVLRKENPVYLAGLDLVEEDDEIVYSFNSCPDGFLETRDCVTLEDRRKDKYFIEEDGLWVEKKIEKIGVAIPHNSISTLGEEQLNQNKEVSFQRRIKEMSPKDKRTEVDSLLNRFADKLINEKGRVVLKNGELSESEEAEFTNRYLAETLNLEDKYGMI